MFVRHTNDATSHIAYGWSETAFCGVSPFVRSSLGWTVGATSAYLADLTICEACKAANGARS